ncbi:hypothetical protein LB542_09695 [Mesorhizobium sp. BR1-1-9]|uniref:DUF6882 domain-containing protein n=1 Tax=unclassified Mesorhizobium TaxID=325217 RepID=UPI00112AD8C1|nr:MULTISPECIES: DUF6882 domain-containing protein [unclassified Mesorhizobium]MBZ9810607.1 hypothetical protein [Mesorhizobium sp. ESP-6-2]MBZ9871130.1 hypothetical protein [Mesorhizobium sp. BR1-1-9]MBZ9943818.1 hypothetical protein [Mesorhizobium sp. BR1-1-13]TPM34012.1 hypothetical protein FJ955_04585 [Mesorhizobium sp. B2-2-2]
MKHPDWYPAWRDEAFDELKAKNTRLRDFRLGSWSRYDYDLTAGTLLFSEEGVVKVVAEIQVAGTTSVGANNWLWAWANSNLPGEVLDDAKRVRSFGEENGIDDLAQAYVTNTDNLEALGWGLAGATVRICNALGAYRSPSVQGGLYLILKTIKWAN